jgi:aspartate aminotransferase-like enzyme
VGKASALDVATLLLGLEKYGKTQPFTPATSMLFQLDASLDYIHAQGLSHIFERRREVAERIRDLVRRSGMEIYPLKPAAVLNRSRRPPDR